MKKGLALKFCFKAGKIATETLQSVNAAYGDQQYPIRKFSDGIDEFVMDEKTMNMIPEVVGLQNLTTTTMSRRFHSSCFKPVTFL